MTKTDIAFLVYASIGLYTLAVIAFSRWLLVLIVTTRLASAAIATTTSTAMQIIVKRPRDLKDDMMRPQRTGAFMSSYSRPKTRHSRDLTLSSSSRDPVFHPPVGPGNSHCENEYCKENLVVEALAGPVRVCDQYGDCDQ
ncbi:MAG: hypothetical protein MZV49_12100 [Rhodopseudomonas palustris]|nr:hypothetical protein [Rhodopseudomonas palustris]